MNIYYENLLDEATTLLASNRSDGTPAEYLRDPMLCNGVVFNGNNTLITLGWDTPRFANSLCILDSNFAQVNVVIKNSGEVIHTEYFEREYDNTIIKLPETFLIDRIEIELEAIEQLYAGLIIVCRREELPRFKRGLKYSYTINSQGERTRYGSLYGVGVPSLRTFGMDFTDLSNEDRLKIERYINIVQFVVPHLIEPYTAPEFPPIYAGLTAAGEFTRDEADGFRWSTSLAYTEAK